MFEAILRKHIGWFDDKSRAPGVLSNMLTENINQVNGLTSEAIGSIVEAGLGLFLSCVFCFFFSVKLAVIVIIFCPFLTLGGLGIAKL